MASAVPESPAPDSYDDALRREILRGGYDIRANTAFEAVVAGCADRDSTWINDRIFALYLALGLYVTVMAWDDFPRWFTLACLLTLPLQVWLGWWLAWGRRRA